MPESDLEHRLSRLEDIVERLVHEADRPRRKDWRRTVGMFRGDPVMREITEAGRAIREEERRAEGA